ncbi:MAG: hypothetical protein ACAH79_02645 [Thermoleophilia bacterium]
MSDSQEAAEAVEEQEAAPEAEAPQAVEPEAEAPAEEPEAPAAEAEPEAEPEPEAEAEPEAAEPEPDAEPSDEPDPEILAAEEELAEEAIPTPVGPASGRQAKVYLCDRGHRTVAIWSAPTTCHTRPTRSGGECGRPLYSIGELPEQVQKALNPLKASKKGSKA